MKYLLISEKPSLMRAVQSAFLKARMNFDVDFMSLHGHCCTLCSPGDYKKEWEKWNLEQLPMIPDTYKHKPVDDKVVKDIQKQLNSTHYDGFINCTDAEREGQNIFYSLYDYLGSDLPVKRFWASDLTDEKLIEAWKNLKDDQHDKYLKNLTDAALLRANADWLVGMNFTRMVSTTNGKVIPIGRVMTTVLAILSQRELDIKNFKPTTTYDVMLDYKEGFSGKLKHDPFKTKEEAEKIANSTSNAVIVESFESKTKTSEAPLLYSLGDLQNDANKEYGYSLADSLAIIQKLYEGKILSYPRTDCPYLTTGEGARMTHILAAAKCVPAVQGIEIDEARIAGYTKTKYVNDKKVQAHYAIVFTGRQFDFDKLPEDQQNICTLVAKRIVATLLDPAQVTEVVVTAKDKDNIFLTKENVLTYAGWKSLYGEKEASVSIKNIKQGQQLVVNKAYVKDVVSSCPARFNDATLNKAMINVGTLIEDKELASALNGKTKDQGGIGTPATRAGIVEKLLDPKKNWVIRKGKSFYVTETGLDVFSALRNYSVASPILTAQWEKKLKDVEEGRMESSIFTTEINKYVTDECNKLKEVKLESGLHCPYCGSPIKESKDYYICTKYKDTCTFIVGKKTSGANITEADIKSLIEKKETSVKTFTSKEGKKFAAKIVIENNKMKFAFANDDSKNATKIICSCGKNIKYLNGQYGKFYKCECGKILSEVYRGHKFTKTEVKKLFEDKTVLIEDLKGQSGKSYDAYFKMEDGKIKFDSFGEKKK